MKPTIIILALLIAQPAHAYARSDDVCEVLGAGAEAVMTMRQNGQSMSGALKSVRRNSSGILREMLEVYVRLAYNRPRYQTPKVQREAIADFRSEREAVCYSVVTN